tara:strand:- start:3278 stop:4549 length:1272 start_codon:yes stop_codon:yes gene_type:complete
MTDSPIFIHSLFRAGSTYIFNVFRRSKSGYWCYQEPFHESAYFAKHEPNLLLQEGGVKMFDFLRHPTLDKDYFHELHSVWPAWRDALVQPVIYDAYFAPAHMDVGINFLETLIDATKSRTVIQECRTSGRIGTIKKKIGGHHIYLWRNPWDQWWSYKVADYFDVANQVIINGREVPDVVKRLRNVIAFEAYNSLNINDLFKHFALKPLSAENSYLVFYTLWCLGLREGLQYADLMINIDRLSESPEYQSEIENKLLKADIEGIHFSDCSVPQGFYHIKERDFFTSLENKVYGLLVSSGWTQSDVNLVTEVRKEFEPSVLNQQVKVLNSKDIEEQSRRAKDLAKRYENKVAQISVEYLTVKIELDKTQNRFDQAEARINQAEARIKQADAALTALHKSFSWRITVPLRKLSSFIKSIQQRIKRP